jgi:endonuclease YncB( thermonuclease family)
MFLPTGSFSANYRSASLLCGAVFAFGVTAGTLLKPAAFAPSIEPAAAAVVRGDSAPARLANHAAHPAEVLRILDGDTFEARVHVWPGLDVTTKVRLRGIDAPELKARCPAERAKAEAAQKALAAILAEGGVEISRVGLDKFGGRVDAEAATTSTPDVSAALLTQGLARRYGGGRRDTWCNPDMPG